MIPDPWTVASYALQYSGLSLTASWLEEISLDDFLGNFANWCDSPKLSCNVILQQVIANTKLENPSLKFGITLYVDELASLAQNQNLTASLRDQIDTIHFYVQYREQGPQFETYVQQVQNMFPKATVIAGAYPYDRISYATCSISKNAPCTVDEELSLYEQTLRVQVRLLRQGKVSGIEFYPGYFGMEGKWAGWNNAKICPPERKEECIANTKAMHSATLQILDGN